MAQQRSIRGIDIAKLVLHVVGMDDTGAVVLRKRLARSEVLHCIPPAFKNESMEMLGIIDELR